LMYLDGNGVDQDFEEAFIWFSIAAEQGNSEAKCNLGLMYIDGNGLPESLTRAAKLIFDAYEKDCEFAEELWNEYELWNY